MVWLVGKHEIHFSVFNSRQIARASLPLSFGQFGAMTQVQFSSTFIPLLRSSVVVVVVVHCILFWSRRLAMVLDWLEMVFDRLAMVFDCQIGSIKFKVRKIDTNAIIVFEQCSMFAGV